MRREAPLVPIPPQAKLSGRDPAEKSENADKEKPWRRRNRRRKIGPD